MDNQPKKSLSERAQFIVRIDRSLHKSFRSHCFEHDLKMSEVVTKMLTEFLKKEKK